MLGTSPQSPVGSTRRRRKQWQDFSRLVRTGYKEQILLACKMGKQHRDKLGQTGNFSLPF